MTQRTAVHRARQARLLILVMLAAVVVVLPLSTDRAEAVGGGWEPLGGILGSSPAAVSWGQGRLDVFVNGADGQLWHRWYDNGWYPWEPLGGILSSAPAAASWGPGRLDVFVTGADGQLWHRWYDNAWQGWEPLGGSFSSAPAAASWSDGRLDIFALGTDLRTYHRWYDASVAAWSAWEDLGFEGRLLSAPAAVAPAFGRLELFGAGGARVLDPLLGLADLGLVRATYETTPGWVGWQQLDDTRVGSAPAAASWNDSRIDVFARGTSGDLLHATRISGTWSGWASLGGALTSGPGAASWSPERIDVFVRGTDAQLWHRWYENGWG